VTDSCKNGNEPSGEIFDKLSILSASQEGLRSMELVNKCVMSLIIIIINIILLCQ
jgi:hypothetical protein